MKSTLGNLQYALLVSAAIAGSMAQAQQAGTYMGTTEQGLHVQFVVENDAMSNAPYLTLTYWETPANCPKPLQDIQYLSHMMMVHEEVVMGSSEVSQHRPEGFDHVRLKFHGDQVRGVAKGSTPFLVDGSPKVAQACYSGAVRFTADLVSAERLPLRASKNVRTMLSTPPAVSTGTHFAR